MGRQRDEDALQVAYAFFNEIGIISQLASNQLQRELPFDLTQSQFSVLNWFVRVDKQASPGRLASAFQVTRGAMTNTLGKLSRKGFITVEPDPGSGRQKIVRLTRDGRRARDKAIAASFPVLEDFLDRFGAEQIQTALPLLQAVRAYLDRLRD